MRQPSFAPNMHTSEGRHTSRNLRRVAVAGTCALTLFACGSGNEQGQETPGEGNTPYTAIDVAKLPPVERFSYDYSYDIEPLLNANTRPIGSTCLSGTAYDAKVSSTYPYHPGQGLSVITTNKQGQIIVKLPGIAGADLLFNVPDPPSARPLIPANEQTKTILDAYGCTQAYRNSFNSSKAPAS